MTAQSHSVILLVGPPGAGKGTQSQKLVDQHGWFAISTGDVFRKHIQQKTELGLKVSNVISSGQLVSDDLTLQVLQSEISLAAGRSILLDGYPRNVSQCESLEKIHCDVRVVIHLDVDNNELTQRVAKRALVSNRADDQPEKFQKRLLVYDNETKPILEYYQKKGLYRRIDGSLQELEVAAKIQEILKNQHLIEE